MRTASLPKADAKGLGAIARALLALNDVEAVRLDPWHTQRLGTVPTVFEPNPRYGLFVILAVKTRYPDGDQPEITETDNLTIGPGASNPGDSPLSQVLREVRYTDTEAAFIAGISGPEAEAGDTEDVIAQVARILDLPGTQVLAMAEAPIAAAPYGFHPETGTFCLLNPDTGQFVD